MHLFHPRWLEPTWRSSSRALHRSQHAGAFRTGSRRLAWRRARRGISLLEVLISMLVLAVGLLGMASLLPIGRFEMTETGKIDRASTLGRASFRDSLVRGYLRPGSWLYANNTPVLANFTQSLLDPLGNARTLPFSLVVVDPLAVSRLRNLADTFPFTLPPGSPMSPLPGSPRVDRLTVRSSGTPGPISHLLAQRIFSTNDDVMFEFAPNAELRPRQVYGGQLVTGGPAVMPQYAGDYSWFITVTPPVRAMLPSGNSMADLSTSRQFQASVVVVYKRTISLDPVGEVPGERMVWADFTSGGGGTSFNGGDVRLRTNANPKWLEVKPNQWILLTANMNDPRLASGVRPVGAWYRIRSVGEGLLDVTSPGGVWFIDVSLDGPDWTTIPGLVPDANSFDYSASMPAPYNFPTGELPTAHATLVTGVVGVYEKTITLDGASLWSN